MAVPTPTILRRNALLLCLLALLGACASGPRLRPMTAHECMTRVMYFESNRSSPDGMLAVGTVVMNRLNSGLYPKSVCGVVGQKNQFAPGVLRKPMHKGRDLAAKMATRVLRGERHPRVSKAMFFHTAGMTFPYTNMHYLVEAGGNVFYEKRKNARRIGDPPFRNPAPRAVQYAPRSVYVAEAPRFARSVPVSPRRAAPTPHNPGLAPMSVADLIAASGD
ncbi:cell wall hydrolase [Aurantimonas marianensis]|uniref:cell wall hydrolase n=1 Tax=Aurantimonas marianensis TaxID=2920428 RepID=UPI003C3024D0